MPPRSTGCLNCRKRKIKCDETRPTCNKCGIHGVPCPGYRGLGPSGLEFRDETAAVTRRVLAKQTPPSNSGTSPNASNTESGLGSSNSSPGEIPRSIVSTSVTRAQMFDVSMRFYRPSTDEDMLSKNHFSDFSVLQEWLSGSSHPALLAAVDALSLAQLGMSFGDQKLFGVARRRYGMALSGLVVALGRQDVLVGQRATDVLATMKLLEYCELFQPIGQEGSWISHINGVENFLKRRGPRPIKTSLENMLFFHARHSAILHGLVGRTANLYAEPRWQAVSKTAYYSDVASRLMDILICIPGIWERADKHIEDDVIGDATDVATDLSIAIDSLYTWMAGWYAEMNHPGYRTVDVTYFQAFSGLCKNRTFDKAYDFPTFFTGYLHTLYWIYLASTQQTLIRILCLDASIVCAISLDSLVQELRDNITHMCQMMPYFFEPQASTMGRFGTYMPLIFVLRYFEARNMTEEFAWALEVTNNCYPDEIKPPWMRKFTIMMGVHHDPLGI